MHKIIGHLAYQVILCT